ncbi:MAG: LemA family protein [Magnetococcus sp. YQC-5]
MANLQLDDLDQEPLNEERMRRMKSLMRQLHKEEFEAKRIRLPPVRGSGIIIFISFVTIVIFAATTLYNYNMFVTLREHVMATRGHVEAAVQRRSNLFNTLVNLTLNHAELEREVFRHVAEVRQDFNSAQSTPSEVTAGAAQGKNPVPSPQGEPGARVDAALLTGDVTSASLARLLAVVEQYPDIKSSVTYKQLMADLIKIEDDIFKRRGVANEAIRVFNTRVTSFPWQYLADLTGFEHVDYYHSEHHKEDNLFFGSSSFIRLLPPGMPGMVPKVLGGSAPAVVNKKP